MTTNQQSDNRNDSFLARHWKRVIQLLIAAAACLLLISVLFNPLTCSHFLSADGILSRQSVLYIIAMQTTSAVTAVGLLFCAVRFRRYTDRRGHIVRGVGVLILSVLILPLFAEAALRVTSDPQTWLRQRHWFFIHDPELGWKHRPHAQCMFKNQLVSINSIGLRDDEISADNARASPRLLLLGDSQLFGDGVSAAETIPAEIERLWEKADAINAGVIGYGTDQQLLYYRKYGHSLRPDAVIVVLNASDLRDNARTIIKSGYRKPMFRISNGDLVLLSVLTASGHATVVSTAWSITA
jgi:hypothetical protein